MRTETDITLEIFGAFQEKCRKVSSQLLAVPTQESKHLYSAIAIQEYASPDGYEFWHCATCISAPTGLFQDEEGSYPRHTPALPLFPKLARDLVQHHPPRQLSGKSGRNFTRYAIIGIRFHSPGFRPTMRRDRVAGRHLGVKSD